MNKHAFDIEITSYCQAFCAGCQRNTINGEKREEHIDHHMAYDDFCKLMDNLDQAKICAYIQFCGEFGDPMMHPDIERFIDRALETAPLIINTNGGLRQPKWYAHLAKKHHDKTLIIEFGVDGTDHETNWMYRKGVNWKRCIENMTQWFQNGGQGWWMFLLFNWNWHQIPDAVEMAKDIGCNVKFNKTESDAENPKDGMSPGVYEKHAAPLIEKFGKQFLK